MSSFTPPQGPSEVEPSRLVGRDHEQAVLRGHLAAALAGRGGLVLLGGEAGIGKTTLVKELGREAAARGALVLTGRCYDLSETPPYGPWAELFGPTPAVADLPSLPSILRPGGPVAGASQAALFAEVRDFFAALAARRPLLLVLDDLHWADPASLDLLRHLARQLATLPLLLAATYRADELTRRHPLYQLVPLLVREAEAARLDLRPLDGDAVHALLRARYALPVPDEARLAGYLQDRAEGNPLYLGELLRTLEEIGALRAADGGWSLGELAGVRVPPLLRQVIDGRLARLGEEARELLAIAAVIGQEAPLDLWATVGETAEDRLAGVVERAVEARVLEETPDGGAVRFAHALIREALYEGLLALRRRTLHRRAAEGLAASPDPDPDAVAYHFRQAGDPRAAEWLIQAGARAQRAYAWLTAAERYEAALGLLENRETSAGQRALLLLTLAQLHRYDDPRRGLAHAEEAARLADAAGDGALAACARFDQGHMRCGFHDFRRGIEQMAAALPTLEALPEVERRRLPALALLGPSAGDRYHRGVLMVQLARSGRFDEARRLGEALITSGPGATARGLFALGLVHAALGRPDEARGTIAAARAIYRATDTYAEVTITLAYELAVAVAPYQADRPAERRRLADEAAETWPRARGSGITGDRGWTDLPLLILEARWAEAHEVAVRWGGYTGNSLAAWVLGLLGREQGNAEPARAALRRWHPDGPATEPGEAEWPFALYLQRLAATVALDAGDLPSARQWLAAHDRWLDPSGAVIDRADGQLGWAAYHRAAGELALAREHAERALAQAIAPRQPLALLTAHRLLGELDTAQGCHADATAHLDQALALANACAAPYERALTLLALAELRHATGDRDVARSTLEEARSIFAALGAQPALAQADALAARLADGAGTIGARPTSRYPAGLTAREVEVLKLVAAGLTNAQVAERLFVSPHTVDAHLRAIYGKLGVASRAAATRAALDHGLR